MGQRHTKLPSSPKRHVPPLLHGFGIQAFTVSARSMYKRKVHNVRNEISYSLRLTQPYIWSTNLERSLTSRYQGSRSSGSRQLFLIKMAIYIAKRWKKSIGCFVPDFSHAQESHTCQFFRVFFCHIYETTVCWDPEILLPWQRGVTTSPLRFYNTT